MQDLERLIQGNTDLKDLGINPDDLEQKENKFNKKSEKCNDNMDDDDKIYDENYIPTRKIKKSKK